MWGVTRERCVSQSVHMPRRVPLHALPLFLIQIQIIKMIYKKIGKPDRATSKRLRNRYHIKNKFFSAPIRWEIQKMHRQCSVFGRYPVPGDHPRQAAFRWVSTWMGDRLSAAYTSKRWAGCHFSETVKLGVKWPTVSAQVFRSFPVPSCKCDTT